MADQPRRPAFTLTTINLGTPDPGRLADFYQSLLGWTERVDEPDWVVLRHPHGGVGVSFQLETEHVPPVWPAGPGDQQMMLHLEIRVDDLAAATAYAMAQGARLADVQPQDDVRVCLDLDGHPFCLWTE